MMRAVVNNMRRSCSTELCTYVTRQHVDINIDHVKTGMHEYPQ
jgi:hypothetical protein